MAGEIVMREARDNSVHVLPVDSEHNAIFQCLAGGRREDVSRIVLTASGGPFRGYSREQLATVTKDTLGVSKVTDGATSFTTTVNSLSKTSPVASVEG